MHTRTRAHTCKERILKAIINSSIELTPAEISKRTGIKHSTTRVYLRQLLKEGKIVQPYHGTYCSRITHGMIFAPLRVHNVVLSVSAPWLGFSDDVTEWVGDVKVRVQFGLRRRRITGRISCDSGMDRNAVFFALERFFDIVRERTGCDVEEVVVKTFEVNRDYVGVRIDGCKCYTRKGLFGMIERIYQKEDSLVRSEVKVSKPMSLDEFTALIRGGVSSYNLQQGVFMVMQEVRRLTDAVKFNNEAVLRLMKIQKAILDRLERQLQGKDKGNKGVTNSIN